MNKTFYVFILSFLISSSLLFAQDDDVISPERPGFTNPASVVSPKQFQIESGFYFESDKIKGSDIKTNIYLYPTTLLRYGIIKNVELRLQVDVAGTSTSSELGSGPALSGLNPVIIGTKIYLFPQKKARPETALTFSLTLPYIGKKEFVPDYPAPGIGLNFQNELTSKVTIGYSLGMQWNGFDANPKSFITFSPGYNFTKKIAAFVEMYSYYSKGQIPDFRCDAGVTYTPLKNLQLDVFGGPGIAGELTNYFISAGIALRLPN